MSLPALERFEPRTLTRLTAYAARHPGLTGSSAAALLVEEGLRMDAHPGTLFREGALLNGLHHAEAAGMERIRTVPARH